MSGTSYRDRMMALPPELRGSVALYVTITRECEAALKRIAKEKRGEPGPNVLMADIIHQWWRQQEGCEHCADKHHDGPAAHVGDGII